MFQMPSAPTPPWAGPSRLTGSVPPSPLQMIMLRMLIKRGLLNTMRPSMPPMVNPNPFNNKGR